MDDKLKELLAKAQENYEAVLAKADQALAKQKDAETKNEEISQKFEDEVKARTEEAKKFAEQIEQLKQELADQEVKFKSAIHGVNVKVKTEDIVQAAKAGIGAFLKVKSQEGKGTDLNAKDFIVQHVKAALNLSTSGQGLEAIDEVLSREIIERAREAYPILGAVGQTTMPRNMRTEVLTSYPSVQAGIENVAGANIAETDVQRYAEVTNQVAKVNAKPRITDEAMQGADLDLYGHLLDLLDDEVGRYTVLQILFGDGGSKNMRGILSSNRLDLTNGTGQSFKPTIGADPRDPDFYPALGTGVSGGLPATDKATVDWLIDIETSLPTMYLNGAKWYMNRRTLAKFKKLRDADDRPIFAQGYQGERMSILGYPVVIDDYMPEYTAADAPFLIFGKLDQAFKLSPGDIDKMLPDPYSVDGCTVVKYDKEYFEMVGKNDAIIVGAATTAQAA